MPIRAQSADGQIHEFPDGTSPDVIDRAMKAYVQEQNPEPPESPQGSTWLGAAKQFALGAPRALEEDIEGAPEMMGTLMGGSGGGQAIRNIESFFLPDIQKKLGISRAKGEPNAPQGTSEEYAATAGEIAFNPATYIGGEGTAVARVVDAITGAIGAEGMHQLAQSLGVGKTTDAIAQLAGALVGSKARQVPRIARAPTTVNDPQHAREVETLRDFGIEPTAGDVIKSKGLRRAEGTLGSFPFAGGAAEREDRRVGNEVTNAVLREMGDTTTDMHDPNADLSGALNQTRDRLQANFEQTARDLPIEHDRQLGNEMQTVIQDAFDEGLTDAQMNRIAAQADNIMRGFVTGRARRLAMNGATYQALTRKNAPLFRLENDPDPNLAHYGGRLRSALDDAMERTVDRAVRNAYARGQAGGPAQARAQGLAASLETLRDSRRQWYTMLVLSRAMAAGGPEAATGRISAPRLKTLIASTQDDKIQYALQRSNLSRLARAGTAVLTSLPNSSTAERGFMTHEASVLPAAAGRAIGQIGAGGTGATGAIAGNAIFGPLGAAAGAALGFAGPGLTGRALLSPSVQRWLKRQRQSGDIQRNRGPLITQGIRSTEEIGGENDQPPMATMADVGNFAQGGLYGAAKGRGYEGGPVGDTMAGIASGLGEGAMWSGPEVATLKKAVKAAQEAGTGWENVLKLFPNRRPKSVQQQVYRLFGAHPFQEQHKWSQNEIEFIFSRPEWPAKELANALRAQGVATTERGIKHVREWLARRKGTPPSLPYSGPMDVLDNPSGIDLD